MRGATSMRSLDCAFPKCIVLHSAERFAVHFQEFYARRLKDYNLLLFFS